MNKNMILTIFALLLISVSVFALDINAYQEQRQISVNKLNEIKDKIAEMKEDGFSTTRLDDEFVILRQIHENNLFKITNNQLPDFTQFDSRYNSIKEIMAEAYQVKDELMTLNETIKGLSGQMDTTQAKELYFQAEQEFADERYEFAVKNIDATYEKISELQGVQARANAAYEATRKNLATFLVDNRYPLAVIIFTPILVYLIFRKKIKLRNLEKQINEIKFEVEVLKNEIKKAQEIYFVEGKIPEGEYSIKVKLYSEKIREMNRNLALLEEQREGLLNKKAKKAII